MIEKAKIHRLSICVMLVALLVPVLAGACSTTSTSQPEQVVATEAPADVEPEIAAETEEPATEEPAVVEEPTSAAEPVVEEEPSGEMVKVRVAMSAFQDVNSIYVGIEKGFYAEEGIELEIQNTDWSGANELLVGGHVDLATSCDADIVLQNANDQDTTLAFPFYYFAGGGLMYDPNRFDWKTFDVFKEETGDYQEAVRLTLEQIANDGAKIGVSASAAEYSTLVGMVEYAGLNLEDFTILDLAQEELPPALMSNSVDVMIAGIPQRLAVLNEGYETLMDQTALPSTVAHAGFGAHREWVDENPELAATIMKVMFKTLAYIEENPEEGFGIIASHLKEAGTVVSVEDLQGVWNNMEFFISSPEQFQEEVASPGGRFYWQDRFDSVARNLEETEKIEGLDVPLEDLHYALKIVDQID